MSQPSTCSIILAGGKGLRMRSPDRNKVCFEVQGMPAILRAVHTYNACGISHHIVVVGHLANQVIELVGRHYPNVTFAYQPEPLGTGNAAKCGVRILRDLGFDGRVLVVAGDKVLHPAAVTRLAAEYERSAADVAFLTASKEGRPSAGRILPDETGHPCAIVEASEIRLGSLVADITQRCQGAPRVPAAELKEIIRTHYPDEQKARKYCPDLCELSEVNGPVDCARLLAVLAPHGAKTKLTIWPNGRPQEISTADVEPRAREVNLSAYLFRGPALYEGLERVTRDNARGEEYLTDVVQILASVREPQGQPRYRIRSVMVPRAYAPGFNTPEDLRALHDMLDELDETDPAFPTPRLVPYASRRPE
jgi:bifunctional N-acetylglucosamine-1-phosphate-uridyltransferase/glucosamine-1-phosphate-acetyltransferase GlmU-like protein